MKSENILKVIENFKKVLPMAKLERHLKMSESSVNYNHTCGTIHCHAGWYAVAVCDLSADLNFRNGANILAEHLGYDDLFDIMNNMDKKIWGNDFAIQMFTREIAFYHPEKRPHGAENLQHIIDHWTEVYERVKTKELLSNPPVDDLINTAINKKVPELNQIENY